jgi:glycosyltransferase involved in cell wall biosynthesis
MTRRKPMTTVGFVSGTLQGSGGLELFELEIGRGLAGIGWDVSIVYETDGNLSPSWAGFARMTRLDALAGDYADPRVANPLATADVIYAHSPALFAPALRAGHAFGAPAVGHLHLPPEHLRKGLKGLVFGRTRGPVDAEVFSRRSRMSRFIAVSTAMKRQWHQSGLPARRIDVVHNGVDLDRYQPLTAADRAHLRREIGICEQSVLIGFVGRIDPMKGIGELVESFGRLAATQSRPVDLAVVGSPSRYLGDEGARFASELAAHAPSGVHWLGQRDDVARLYGAMDVLVVPSQWDEPFGLVAAEAMAAGVCVVAANRGGLPEILKDDLQVNVVEPSPAGLTARLEELVADRGRTADLGRRGRQVVAANFDLRQTIRNIDASLRAAS